jgi:hypothetical protein
MDFSHPVETGKTWVVKKSSSRPELIFTSGVICRQSGRMARQLVLRGLDRKMARKEDDMDAQVNNGPKAPGTPEQGKSPSKSSAATKALITRNLKLAYGEVAAEPMPQRFLDLLNAIDGEEKKS